MSIGNIYSDASLRLGNLKTKFHSDDIITGSGEIARYTSKAKYFGGHIGAGYVFPVNDQLSFDTSVRYIYTHLGSDSVVIDGDQVNLQSSTSSRIQLKEQLNYRVTDFTTVFFSAGYEYEFNGKAKMNVSGVNFHAPSIKGSTGIFELGVKTQPFDSAKDLSLEFNVRGYTGKTEGASGQIVLRYDF